MEDVGALGSAAASNGCDVTDQLISDLTYVATQYESSPAYMQMNGRPVIFFFGVDAYYIDWSRVISSIPGNPLLIFQGAQRVKPGIPPMADFPGSTSMQAILSTSIWRPRSVFYKRRSRSGNASHSDPFIKASMTRWPRGERIASPISNAARPGSRLSARQASSTPVANNCPPSRSQPGMTTRKERRLSQASTTAFIWRLRSRARRSIGASTVERRARSITTPYSSAPMAPTWRSWAMCPRGTHAFDLGPLKLPDGTYLVYIKATGAPSFQNKMSPAMAYHPGDQPPDVALSISQTGPAGIHSHGCSFLRHDRPLGDRLWRRHGRYWAVGFAHVSDGGDIPHHRLGV